jgi:prefoldin subunit 5
MVTGRMCVLVGRLEEVNQAIERYTSRRQQLQDEIAALQQTLKEHAEVDILSRVVEQLPPSFGG